MMNYSSDDLSRARARVRVSRDRRMTQRMRDIVAYLRSRGSASRAELAEQFKCDPKTAGVHMTRLRAMGIARPTTGGRWSRWVLATEEQVELNPVVDKPEPTPPRDPIEQCGSVWEYGRRMACN